MTQENHSKLIEQIKKLFSLSKSSNEHEASLALQKAQEMMRKYQIDNNDLINDQVEDIIEIDFEVSKKYNTSNSSLAYWIGQAFLVKPIMITNRAGKTIRFIGSKTDLSIATYVYSYMMNILEIKADDYIVNQKAKYPNKDWRGKVAKMKADYSFGFVEAVSEKLRKIKEESKPLTQYDSHVMNQLVVVKNDLIKQYLNKNYDNLKKTKSHVSYNKDHFSAGFSEGERTGIHRGVGSKSQIQIRA